jgi:hypothetical protein
MPGDIIFSGGKIFYNPCSWTRQNLKSIYINSNNKSDYPKTYPIILTKDTTFARNELDEFYNFKILDSVKHWQNGHTYILQASEFEK